ncbi:MAG: SpoIIE family protein phosphatase [Polyangiales bacterium]
MRVQVGSASRAAGGQGVCGDACVIHASETTTTVCVADGLGHGPEAREAALMACDYLQAHVEDPFESLLLGMDAVLSHTRGAAVSILSIEPTSRRARFTSLGNVELRAASRTRIAPPTMPGILGRGVRRNRVWEYSLDPGDVLALVTDGVGSRFDLDALAHLAPQAIADHLIANHHRGHDDACCVVARVVAEGGVR